jgi:hypothetical protein
LGISSGGGALVEFKQQSSNMARVLASQKA